MFVNILVFLGSYAAVFAVRSAAGYPYSSANALSVRLVLPYLVVLYVVLWVAYRLSAYYETPTFETVLNQLFVLVITALASLAIPFAVRAFAFPRGLIVWSFMIQLVSLSVLNVVWSLVYSRTKPTVPVVCVCGSSATGSVGVCPDWITHDRGLAWSVLISSEVTPQVVATMEPETIIVVDRSVPSAERSRIVALAMTSGIATRLVATPGEVLLQNADVHIVSDRLLLSIQPDEHSSVDLSLKRCLDLVTSVIALLVFSPLFLVFAILIMLEDGRPIFYVQCRLGYRGHEFRIIKFRTMRKDAERDGEARLSDGDSDLRITRTGRFLRKSGLDEVPQFVNVLRGEMSVVGPRPERPELARRILEEVPSWNLRLLVKPGITGLAQVSGRYLTAPADKLTLDLAYIRSRFLFVEDLRIILHTFKMFFLPDRRA